MKDEVIRIPTREGMFTAVFSHGGLMRLRFPDFERRHLEGNDATTVKCSRPERLKATEDPIDAVLAGKRPKEMPPKDVSIGTPYQRADWIAMLTIPPGETRSYGEIAAMVGRPNAVRATGGACGANPIPVLIPCHRVLAARGAIGGFSGGLQWKRLLLQREGVLMTL